MKGPTPGELAVAVKLMQVGEFLMLDPHQKNAAYMTAYRYGMKLQVLRTTKGRYRAERIS